MASQKCSWWEEIESSIWLYPFPTALAVSPLGKKPIWGVCVEFSLESDKKSTQCNGCNPNEDFLWALCTLKKTNHRRSYSCFPISVVDSANGTPQGKGGGAPSPPLAPHPLLCFTTLPFHIRLHSRAVQRQGRMGRLYTACLCQRWAALLLSSSHYTNPAFASPLHNGRTTTAHLADVQQGIRFVDPGLCWMSSSNVGKKN